MKTLILSSLAVMAASAFQGDSARTAQFLGAVRKGDEDAVRTMLDSDPALRDARGEDNVPAIRTALYYRKPAIAELLIARGAKLDVHDAAAAGKLDTLRDLLSSNPKGRVNSLSADGASVIGLAAFLGHREAVELLLDRGAAINMLSTNPAFPFTALHSAMSAGHHDVVQLLLDRGADVRTREGGGMTVLHEAAGLGDMRYVKLLLDRGADAAAKTDDGKLPEDFATMRKHLEVASLLSQVRAKQQH